MLIQDIHASWSAFYVLVHISVLARTLGMLTRSVIQKDTMACMCRVAKSRGLELNLAINWLEIGDKAFDSVQMFPHL